MRAFSGLSMRGRSATLVLYHIEFPRDTRVNIFKRARMASWLRGETDFALIGLHLTIAEPAGVSAVYTKIVARWVERFRNAGCQVMLDRSSQPFS